MQDPLSSTMETWLQYSQSGKTGKNESDLQAEFPIWENSFMGEVHDVFSPFQLNDSCRGLNEILRDNTLGWYSTEIFFKQMSYLKNHQMICQFPQAARQAPNGALTPFTSAVNRNQNRIPQHASGLPGGNHGSDRFPYDGWRWKLPYAKVAGYQRPEEVGDLDNESQSDASDRNHDPDLNLITHQMERYDLNKFYHAPIIWSKTEKKKIAKPLWTKILQRKNAMHTMKWLEMFSLKNMTRLSMWPIYKNYWKWNFRKNQFEGPLAHRFRSIHLELLVEEIVFEEGEIKDSEQTNALRNIANYPTEYTGEELESFKVHCALVKLKFHEYYELTLDAVSSLTSIFYPKLRTIIQRYADDCEAYASLADEVGCHDNYMNPSARTSKVGTWNHGLWKQQKRTVPMLFWPGKLVDVAIGKTPQTCWRPRGVAPEFWNRYYEAKNRWRMEALWWWKAWDLVFPCQTEILSEKCKGILKNGKTFTLHRANQKGTLTMSCERNRILMTAIAVRSAWEPLREIFQILPYEVVINICGFLDPEHPMLCPAGSNHQRWGRFRQMTLKNGWTGDAHMKQHPETVVWKFHNVPVEREVGKSESWEHDLIEHVPDFFENDLLIAQVMMIWGFESVLNVLWQETTNEHERRSFLLKLLTERELDPRDPIFRVAVHQLWERELQTTQIMNFGSLYLMLGDDPILNTMNVMNIGIQLGVASMVRKIEYLMKNINDHHIDWTAIAVDIYDHINRGSKIWTKATWNLTHPYTWENRSLDPVKEIQVENQRGEVEGFLVHLPHRTVIPDMNPHLTNTEGVDGYEGISILM